MLDLVRPIVFFDLETTGLDANSDRIVQIAAVKLLPNGQKVEGNQRLNPTIPIPVEATAVHGISNADVADCPTFSDRAIAIHNFFNGCDLAGFNANGFDIPLLANEFARAGLYLDLTEVRCVDASAIFRAFERRTLEAAYQFYCGKTLEGAHNAMVDVRATIEVLQGQIHRYGLEPDVVSLAQYAKQPAIDPSGKVALNEAGQLVLTFGKYQGQTLESVAQENPGYLDWMLDGSFAETTKILIRRFKND